MLLKEKEDVIWLEFELLTHIKNLKHGVFLRHGGFSTGPFSSLNFGFGIGDSHENVYANFKKVQRIFNLPSITLSDCVHGNLVEEINPHELHKRSKCDGLTTHFPNIGLIMTHADCQAALFYDPVHHAIANVHAGWRGNVKNIYRETVLFLKNRYQSNANDLLVCISPSLGPADAQFINYRTELPESFWNYQVKPDYFDLWSISKDQLLECGVLEHHIEIAGISTLSNPQDFYSYRREKPSGRHATMIALC